MAQQMGVAADGTITTAMVLNEFKTLENGNGGGTPQQLAQIEQNKNNISNLSSKVLKKVTPQLQFHLLVMRDMQQQKIKPSLLLFA